MKVVMTACFFFFYTSLLYKILNTELGGQGSFASLFEFLSKKLSFYTVKTLLFKVYFYASNFKGLPRYLAGPNQIKNSDLLPCFLFLFFVI